MHTPLRAGLGALLSVLLLVVLVACGGGADDGGTVDGGDAPGESPVAGETGDIAISADNLQFSTDSLSAPAGEDFTIVFTNEESQPHNVAIYTDESKSERLFAGEIITGPDETVTYEVPALEAGDYYFDCEVHPEMSGTLTVGG